MELLWRMYIYSFLNRKRHNYMNRFFEGRVVSQKTLRRNNNRGKRVATNGTKKGHLTSVTGW